MKITLTARGEELLRVARERYPDQSPAEIVERSLADRVAREQITTPPTRQRTRAEFRAWLDEFAALSEKIPPMPGQTFSRDMIYQEHD